MGDDFIFLMKVRGVGSREAVEEVAARAGVTL